MTEQYIGPNSGKHLVDKLRDESTDDIKALKEQIDALSAKVDSMGDAGDNSITVHHAEHWDKEIRLVKGTTTDNIKENDLMILRFPSNLVAKEWCSLNIRQSDYAFEIEGLPFNKAKDDYYTVRFSEPLLLVVSDVDHEFKLITVTYVSPGEWS